MILSRTARILLAILLLAAAAFFWVSFFYRNGAPSIDLVGAGTLATGSALAQGGIESEDSSAEQDQRANDESTEVDGTVVAPSAPDVATVELDLADFPFLSTGPPEEAPTEEVVEAAVTQGRRQAVRSVSVNPFSPIFIQVDPPQAAAPVPATPGTAVQTLGEPSGTVSAAEAAAAGGLAPTVAAPRAVSAPTPRPLAPPSRRTERLPRQLPIGAPLASTPDLLREPLTMAQFTAGDLGELAALRIPGGNGRIEVGPVAVSEPTLAVEQPVQPLGIAARTTVDPDAPMEAGIDPLARFLRDNDVVFTGSVLGAVSVGVFRSSNAPMPLVVSIGQTLPETDIVLTDLTGLKAEFTLADSTQVLSLDLRR